MYLLAHYQVPLINGKRLGGVLKQNVTYSYHLKTS